MLSKNKIKYIKSLEHKKYRDEYGVFLAEGNKLVSGLIGCFECCLLLAKSSWMATQGDLKAEELIIAGDDDIRKASLLKSPQDVLAVFRKPFYRLDSGTLQEKLSLALDAVQDPGNLGTILRVADWFGIDEVICSPDCADAYNPKTVQATMGALARVKVHYTELPRLLEQMTVPVYGTSLNGDSIYDAELVNKGVIVVGSEGSGISRPVDTLLDRRLFVPDFPAGQATSESLNVAVATAIVCSEFRRRQI